MVYIVCWRLKPPRPACNALLSTCMLNLIISRTNSEFDFRVNGIQLFKSIFLDPSFWTAEISTSMKIYCIFRSVMSQLFRCLWLTYTAHVHRSFVSSKHKAYRAELLKRNCTNTCTLTTNTPAYIFWTWLTLVPKLIGRAACVVIW